MEIQYATSEDLQRIIPLFEGYLHFYEQPFKKEDVHRFLKKRLENEESVILLAEQEGQTIGFTQLYPSFSSLSLKRSYILNDLFVIKEGRKQGAAQALMEEAFAFCEQVGAVYIALETHPDNVQAQQLYEKIGMKRDEEFWHYTKTFK